MEGASFYTGGLIKIMFYLSKHLNESLLVWVISPITRLSTYGMNKHFPDKYKSDKCMHHSRYEVRRNVSAPWISALYELWKQRGKLKLEVITLCGGEIMCNGMGLLTQSKVLLQTVLDSEKMPHSVSSGKSRDFLCCAGGNYIRSIGYELN